jgi:uncharacterized protein YndB with AHSA1/START domain
MGNASFGIGVVGEGTAARAIKSATSLKPYKRHESLPSETPAVRPIDCPPLGETVSSAGCFDGGMTSNDDVPRVVSANREVAAGPGPIFELIADPTQQPRWDGNDNLAAAPAGQRVRRTGDVFTMTTTRGNVRENHVVEFEEGRRIAWKPAEPGQEPPGHLWRWELEPIDASRTRVTHTYDWTQLTDENRFPRARATTPDKLRASLDRLAAIAESS